MVEFLSANYSRHRIIPSRMQRMASTYPLDTQIYSFEDSVLHNSLRHILRASRLEPAVASQVRGDDLLVKTDQECKELTQKENMK